MTKLLGKLYVGILLVIFAGIIFHAPLSVALGTLFPSADLFIKAWKEILMAVALVIGLIILGQTKQWKILKDPIVLLILAYSALHLLLIPLFPQNPVATVAGLLIDLRYLLFFCLVYGAIRLYPEVRRPFISVFFGGALVVGVFALLQVFLLPPDFLSLLGYNENTIMPFLTVDQNMEYIRINSTLRGPNPLGAYAVIVLAALIAFWLRGDHSKVRRPMAMVTLTLIGSVVALWASYSRTALVAAIVAIGLVLLLTIGRRLSKWVWVVVFVVALAAGGALFVARDTPFVSNILLHENRESTANDSSNEGHIDSLQDGVDRAVHQPLGGGIGSTGSASVFGDETVIIENQYLFIAHETGWLGLGLFLVIFFKVLKRTWQRRADWLGLAVLASGVGLALIGLLLPVWVDDTVSVIWWGLVAPIIGGSYGRTVNKATKRTA